MAGTTATGHLGNWNVNRWTLATNPSLVFHLNLTCLKPEFLIMIDWTNISASERAITEPTPPRRRVKANILASALTLRLEHCQELCLTE